VEDFKPVVEILKLVVDLVFSTLHGLFHSNKQKNTLVWVVEILFSKIQVAENFGLRNAVLDEKNFAAHLA
jgi:hypothetical protein